MAIIQTCRPIGPGSIPDPYLTTPARGFFCTPSTSAFWQVTNNVADDTADNNTYAGFAVSDSQTFPAVQISNAIPAFEGPSNSIINYIKVYCGVSAGYDSAGNPTPVGQAGDNLYFGIRTGNPRVNYYQYQVLNQTGSYKYSKFFYTKDGTNYAGGVQPFTPADLVNLELYLCYGYYWTTADKSLSVNDAYHNAVGQWYLEISYDVPVAQSTGELIMMLM